MLQEPLITFPDLTLDTTSTALSLGLYLLNKTT